MKRRKVKNNDVHKYTRTSNPVSSDSVRETSSTLTHFSSYPTDVSIYKAIEAMFLAHGITGSAATYTKYPVDTHLVATTSFTGSPDLRDQGSDKLHNVPAFMCLQHEHAASPGT